MKFYKESAPSLLTVKKWAAKFKPGCTQWGNYTVEAGNQFFAWGPPSM